MKVECRRSLVGQSEERTRQALATVDAMAPCVLMIDEVEKASAGATGSNGDSGVSSRMWSGSVGRKQSAL
jgi:SpoVK/Ycf46/Vps4 family AAA+-type ATPase